MASKGGGKGVILVLLVVLGAIAGVFLWVSENQKRRAAPVRANNEAVQLINNGQFQEALNSLDEAMKTWPREAKLHLNRAVALQELGRYEEAIEQWRRTAEIDSDLLTRSRIEIENCRELMQDS